MENLNEKYNVTRENFIIFINRLCNKRAIIFQLNNNDSDFDIIKKLNKILISLKLKKLKIGFNILDNEIQNIIPLNKGVKEKLKYLLIINKNNATSEDVYELINLVHDTVLEKTTVDLIIEQEFIGWD